MHRSRTSRFLAGALALAATAATVGYAWATHPDETTSAGIYRIPYADGTLVDVSGDAHNHGGPNGSRDRIDMVAYADPLGTRVSPSSGPVGLGAGTALVVAAASGTIAVIQDTNGGDYGRGDGLAFDGTAQLGMGNDALEHRCQDNAAGDVVVGRCSQHNNYVWIAHPNGEWTKYSHFRTGTVTIDRNWAAGDAVQVGDVLGEEGDVGFASGTHLHFEVADLGPYDSYDTDGDGILSDSELPDDLGSPGGFISGAFQNHDPQVCDVNTASFSYVDDSNNATLLVAGDCANTVPVADAGGPYSVDEGSTVALDGTASSDPHNAVLTYSWIPGDNLDDPASPTPVYSAVDDTIDVLTLTVGDEGGDVSAGEALSGSDDTTVTVTNVAPEVDATGDEVFQGNSATVTGTFTDPGTDDTHEVSIDWGDGTPAQGVTEAQLNAGVDHLFGDDGDYSVTVTVTDDDGGTGSATVIVTVVPVADLSITKSDDPDPALVDETVGYTLTVHNVGPSEAVGTAVTDTLPVDVVVVSAVPSQGSCSELPGVLQCLLGTVAPGATATVDVDITSPVKGTHTNTATVASDTTDLDPTDNSTAEVTTILSLEGTGAFGALVDYKTPLLGLAVQFGPSPSVDLPASGGGPLSDPLLSSRLPAALNASALKTSTEGGRDGDGAIFSASSADVGRASLAGGLVVVEGVHSDCRATLDGSEGTARIASLRLGGLRVRVNGTAVIPIPGVGTLRIGEQTSTSAGFTQTRTVNAVHLELDGLAGTGDVILAQSRCVIDP